jgi:hypothetical protein
MKNDLIWGAITIRDLFVSCMVGKLLHEIGRVSKAGRTPPAASLNASTDACFSLAQRPPACFSTPLSPIDITIPPFSPPFHFSRVLASSLVSTPSLSPLNLVLPSRSFATSPEHPPLQPTRRPSRADGECVASIRPLPEHEHCLATAATLLASLGRSIPTSYSYSTLISSVRTSHNHGQAPQALPPR